MSEPGDVTRLLESWRGGRDEAADELLPLVYDELRRIARAVLARERQNHPLQPTALVHEAFLRLVVQRRARISSHNHFLSVAARAMRRILVEHERRRRADKRGGGDADVPLLDVADLAMTTDGMELLDPQPRPRRAGSARRAQGPPGRAAFFRRSQHAAIG